jgi:hypothetical protein
MATLSATAQGSQRDVRQTVVDFSDGTYGVHLGNNFYRVDADLPRSSATGDYLQNARFGDQGSLWVAIVEKAYASFRTGANTYDSLGWGGAGEAMKALNLRNWGYTWVSSNDNDAGVANIFLNHWKARDVVGIQIGTDLPSVGKLHTGHVYSFAGVNLDTTGIVTSVVFRDPYGGSSAYITLTVSELGLFDIGIDSASV